MNEINISTNIELVITEKIYPTLHFNAIAICFSIDFMKI